MQFIHTTSANLDDLPVADGNLIVTEDASIIAYDFEDTRNIVSKPSWHEIEEPWPSTLTLVKNGIYNTAMDTKLSVVRSIPELWYDEEWNKAVYYTGQAPGTGVSPRPKVNGYAASIMYVKVDLTYYSRIKLRASCHGASGGRIPSILIRDDANITAPMTAEGLVRANELWDFASTTRLVDCTIDVSAIEGVKYVSFCPKYDYGVSKLSFDSYTFER